MAWVILIKLQLIIEVFYSLNKRVKQLKKVSAGSNHFKYFKRSKSIQKSAGNAAYSIYGSFGVT